MGGLLEELLQTHEGRGGRTVQGVTDLRQHGRPPPALGHGAEGGVVGGRVDQAARRVQRRQQRLLQREVLHVHGLGREGRQVSALAVGVAALERGAGRVVAVLLLVGVATAAAPAPGLGLGLAVLHALVRGRRRRHELLAGGAEVVGKGLGGLVSAEGAAAVLVLVVVTAVAVVFLLAEARGVETGALVGRRVELSALRLLLLLRVVAAELARARRVQLAARGGRLRRVGSRGLSLEEEGERAVAAQRGGEDGREVVLAVQMTVVDLLGRAVRALLGLGGQALLLLLGRARGREQIEREHQQQLQQDQVQPARLPALLMALVLGMGGELGGHHVQVVGVERGEQVEQLQEVREGVLAQLNRELSVGVVRGRGPRVAVALPARRGGVEGIEEVVCGRLDDRVEHQDHRLLVATERVLVGRLDPVQVRGQIRQGLGRSALLVCGLVGFLSWGAGGRGQPQLQAAQLPVDVLGRGLGRAGAAAVRLHGVADQRGELVAAVQEGRADAHLCQGRHLRRNEALHVGAQAQAAAVAVAPGEELAGAGDGGGVLAAGGDAGEGGVLDVGDVAGHRDVLFVAVAELAVLPAAPAEHLALRVQGQAVVPAAGHGEDADGLDGADQLRAGLALAVAQAQDRRDGAALGVLVAAAPREHLAVVGQGQAVLPARGHLHHELVRQLLDQRGLQTVLHAAHAVLPLGVLAPAVDLPLRGDGQAVGGPADHRGDGLGAEGCDQAGLRAVDHVAQAQPPVAPAAPGEHAAEVREEESVAQATSEIHHLHAHGQGVEELRGDVGLAAGHGANGPAHAPDVHRARVVQSQTVSAHGGDLHHSLLSEGVDDCWNQSIELRVAQSELPVVGLAEAEDQAVLLLAAKAR